MNPPKMPIHIGDYKRDTGHLYAAEHGAYLLLLFHHWSTGALPTDDRQLAAIACMSPSEWKRTKPVLAPFFQPGWTHGRVIEDLKKAQESYERRAGAGKEGGKAKAESKHRASNATAMLEPEASNASAETKQCSSYLIPLTTNQSSKKKETREDALSYDFEFAGFWEIWPNKVGKPAALKAFLSARKRAGLDAIVEGVFAYIRDKPPDRPWLNPATFLNQNRWEDQPAKVEHGTSNNRSGGSLVASIRRELAELEQSEGSDFALPGGSILRISN